MKARFRSAPAGALNWWPLSGGDNPGGFAIGNQPLRTLQEARMREAGIAPADTDAEAALECLAHAWVEAADWKRLLVRPGARGLAAVDGTLLVERPGATGEPVPALDSFAIRHPWDLLRVHERCVGALAGSCVQGEVSPAAHVEGELVLGQGSRLLPGVVIEGNAVIGEKCKIGPNCYLRGPVSIGDGCHIGHAVEIKNSILGPGTNVGHLSYVGDSILGAGVNFGAGTMVSNLRHDERTHRSQVEGELVDTGRRKFGTVVGDGVHTGINTTLYPGRKLGRDSSTRPAAVVQKDLPEGSAL